MRVKLFLGALAAAVSAFGQGAQSRTRIDVQDYAIEAQIDPRTQTLVATAKVRFTPLDDTANVSFELNNSLNLSRVTDEQGQQVSASRFRDDMSVRISLPQPLPKGKPATLVFVYDGKLKGDEESPVFGIKFAAIKPDITYLLYPARWFPVNEYTTDRFSSDLKVTVPTGYKVLGSGVDLDEPANDGWTSVRFKFSQAGFPGSIAVVRGQPKAVSSGGVTTSFYLRSTADMASAYGEEFARAMGFFTDVYGVAPKRNLTVVETEAGTPNGYASPGLIFLSPSGIGKEVNLRLVANQVARQWVEQVVSPTTRNHLWIENGLARYSEFLYFEHVNGPNSIDNLIHDNFVEALTVEQPPLIQSARLEDYSPEFWAATAGKGAAILHMLRGVIGEDNFSKVLKTLPERYAWKSVNTDDFRKLAEEVSGQNLNYFFIQWVESSGAPEFTLSYTIMRCGSSCQGQDKKGFRVVGKISQDLDTFRMPVTLRVDTEGNPEEKTIEVTGTSTEFVVETFGKPKSVTLDAKGRTLRYDNTMRVAVAIKRGEQFAEISELQDALKEYQKALDVSPNSSLAHYRMAELFFIQGNYQTAANDFKSALNGDLEPKWTEVWSHINMGQIYDVTGSRDRAVNEYRQALRTKDDTQGAQEVAQKYINQPYERKRNPDQ